MAWDYDVSADGRQIVLDAADPAGQRALWLVLLERESSPFRIPNGDGGRQPKFMPDGDIIFRRVEGTTNVVYRIQPDGSRKQKPYSLLRFARDDSPPSLDRMSTLSTIRVHENPVSDRACRASHGSSPAQTNRREPPSKGSCVTCATRSV